MIKCHWEKDIGLELCIDTVSILLSDSIDRVSHAATTQRLSGVDAR